MQVGRCPFLYVVRDRTKRMRLCSHYSQLSLNSMLAGSITSGVRLSWDLQGHRETTDGKEHTNAYHTSSYGRFIFLNRL
jgi:hypothetical protein